MIVLAYFTFIFSTVGRSTATEQYEIFDRSIVYSFPHLCTVLPLSFMQNVVLGDYYVTIRHPNYCNMMLVVYEASVLSRLCVVVKTEKRWKKICILFYYGGRYLNFLTFQN